MADATVPTITLLAYQLWEAAGRPQGRDEEFYFQAEEQFRKLLELEPREEAGDN
jgi:hypothetical protein